MKCCVDCGRITQRTRCPNCQQQANKRRNQTDPHQSPEWQRTSRRLRAEWVATHGWWCPGDEHHGHHPSHDLTVHHSTPLAAGGSLIGQTLRRVCRSANSSLGARVEYRDGTDPRD